MKPRLVWLALVCGCLGCSALFQKSEPLTVQYFSPEDRAGRFPRAAESAPRPALRIARITSLSHLDTRLVERSQQNTLIYRDAARWSENPARFLERGLAHALFEEHGIRQAISGRALTLDAELIAFEQIQNEVRVSITWTLHDEKASLSYETLSVTRGLKAGDVSAGAVARALSEALDECVAQIAARVVSELAGHEPAP